MRIHPRDLSPGLLGAVLAWTVLAACQGSPTTSGPHDDDVVVAVTVQLAASTAGVGEASQASALPVNAAGRVLPPRATTWGTSSAAIATVDAAGQVSAVGPGAASITAQVDGVRGSATLVVTAGLRGALQVACEGPNCGAVSATACTGSGVGTWMYTNGGAAPALLDIEIAGVTEGQRATLVFSNGSTVDLPTLPSAGVLLSPVAQPMPVATLARVEDEVRGPGAGHEAITAANREMAREILSAARQPRPVPQGALAAPVAQPRVAVGDTRTWNEPLGWLPQPYATVARATCALPGGRTAVFWVDPAATAAGNMTDADLAYFTTTFCGTTGADVPSDEGGFGRVRSLLGDPWGPYDPIYAGMLIADEPTLQDVNLVFLQVAADPARPPLWAGYFALLNLFRRDFNPPDFAQSNEALVVVVDASQMHIRDPESRAYLGSTVLHEFAHMVNLYQRSVLRYVEVPTWSAELAASMVEDLVTPMATPDRYAPVPRQRIRPYVRSGGAIGLVPWNFPAQNPYAVAGTLAAYVDRRHGPSVLSGMMTCATEDMECLDGLLRSGGGAGFADEFARAGASAFALLPSAGIPGDWGFPAETHGAYSLAGVDVSAYASYLPSQAAPLGPVFPATSQTFQADVVGPGAASYHRTAVVVPEGTSLVVIVR